MTTYVKEGLLNQILKFLLKIQNKIILPAPFLGRGRGITFRGTYFYFTLKLEAIYTMYQTSHEILAGVYLTLNY